MKFSTDGNVVVAVNGIISGFWQISPSSFLYESHTLMCHVALLSTSLLTTGCFCKRWSQKNPQFRVSAETLPHRANVFSSDGCVFDGLQFCMQFWKLGFEHTFILVLLHDCTMVLIICLDICAASLRTLLFWAPCSCLSLVHVGSSNLCQNGDPLSWIV